MQYSDTSSKTGIIQDAEMALFGDSGYGQISSNPNRLLQFTARVNRRFDRFVQLAFEADGRWQWDDTNNTDFPIATTNIISGQRDYTFDVAMLEIEKVMIYPAVASANTAYITIYPADIRDTYNNNLALNNPTNVGAPYRYDKTANSVILDPTPNYSSISGLKVIFKRGPSYFASTDTTKVPGFASLFHNYLSRGAALDYSIDREMPVANNLSVQVAEIEKKISSFFNRRAADERPVMTNQPVRYM